MTTSAMGNSQCAFPSMDSHTVKRSNLKRALYPRRHLVTSMSQALIAMSLAVSILTFVISLVEFLPSVR